MGPQGALRAGQWEWKRPERRSWEGGPWGGAKGRGVEGVSGGPGGGEGHLGRRVPGAREGPLTSASAGPRVELPGDAMCMVCCVWCAVYGVLCCAVLYMCTLSASNFLFSGF